MAFLEAIRPLAIEEAEEEGNFNRATYLITLMSQYWGDSGSSKWFWDHLIEGLQKYYNDITPSQSDLEKEIPENLVLEPRFTDDYNFICFPYGGEEGDYIWRHYKVNRVPGNDDCWVMECSVIYYVRGERHTENQYAVLLPGKTYAMLYEGDAHTFDYIIPWDATDINWVTSFYCFQKM